MTWYYLLKGRPTGPASMSDLRKEIAVGRIGPKDMLYQEHDTQWRAAETFNELKELFKGEALQDSWVLLLKKVDGSGFKQKGPLTRSHVMAMLRNGEVSYNDHIWRKGLKEWYKISSLPEFSHSVQPEEKSLPPLPDNTDLPLDLSEQTVKLKMPSVDSEETRSVVKAEVADKSKVSTAPVKVHAAQKASVAKPTASTVAAAPVVVATPKPDTSSFVLNLEKTQTFTNVTQPEKPKKQKHIKRPSVTTPPTENFVKRLSPLQYFLALTPVKRVSYAGGILLIGGAVFVLLTFVSTYFDRKNIRLVPARLLSVLNINKPQVDSTRATGTVASAPNSYTAGTRSTNEVSASSPVTAPSDSPQAVSPAAAPVVVKAPAPKVEEVVKPTYLRVEVTDQGLASAGIKIIADGSKSFPIQVTVQSEGGNALDDQSVYKIIRLKKTAEREVYLKQQALPFGYYTIDIEMNGLKAGALVQYGTQTDDFSKKLTNIKKRLVYYHNEERYSFIKVVSRIEAQAQNFVQSLDRAGQLNSWSSYYKSWRKEFDRIKSNKLSSFSNRTRKNYVHPSLWAQLREHQARFSEQVRSANKMKNAGQPVDSKEIREVLADISKIKEQMLQKSLWN